MIQYLVLLNAVFCAVFVGQTLQPHVPGRPSPNQVRQTSVTGVITDSETGQPLDDVLVQLSALREANLPLGLVYGALSKSNGTFSIIGIEPGEYLLRCERTGFVLAPMRQVADRFVTVQPSGHVELRVRMVAPAILSGHVLDEYGDPLPNIPVQAEPSGRKRSLPGLDLAGQTTTDDRGEFRLPVTPGKYRLKVWGLSGIANGPREIRSDGTTAAAYRDAYYPGVADSAAASIIDVKPGEQRGSLDFQLAPVPVLSITGTVEGAAGLAGSCSMSVMYGSTPDRIQSGYSGGGVIADGNSDPTFVMGNLAPGFYKIGAQCQAGEDRLYSRIESVTLSQSDVTGIALVLRPAEEVSGVIEPNDVRHGAHSVALQPVETLPGTRSFIAEVAADGSFTLTKVARGRYKFTVQPLPENGYIESVQVNGKQQSGAVVDVTDPPTKLRIKVNPHGARLSGTVRNQKGDPIPLLSMVFLSPLDRQYSQQDLIVARTDAGGKYAFKGLPPGKYRLFAIDEMSGVSDFDDKIRETAAKAGAIELKQGESAERDLRPASIGNADASD